MQHIAIDRPTDPKRIAVLPGEETATRVVPRDPAWRRRYLDASLPEIPRLLGAIDRNPFHATYGCLDRQFWHYRTSDFPCEMYQEGVLPLALVYAHAMPGNRWYGCPRVRELCIAALRFSARSAHPDGSCDDYYPFERALGAAVFSLAAAAEACLLLEIDDHEIGRALVRRGRWLLDHDETGRLANHQALAAWGLLLLGQWTGRGEFRDAAAARIARVLAWQHDEGWFDEYGGADPGYQTVTIDCLAKYRRATSDTRLAAPIARAVAFAGHFLHPDGSFGGEYGSRGTYHFYPHGAELLTRESPDAANLADGFLSALSAGRQAYFADDRMYAHRLGNLIAAYRDWSDVRPAARPSQARPDCWLPGAGLYVRRLSRSQTVVSAARGGVFKHFDGPTAAADQQQCRTDAGLVVEFDDGRVAVSQFHHHQRAVQVVPGQLLRVEGALDWADHETATPLKLVLFRVLLVTVGRWARSAVRRLLQRRLITRRRPCPARLERVFEFREDLPGRGHVRVTDVIRLTHSRLKVRRMAFGVDHQSSYVAACGVYQQSVLQPWTMLDGYVARLNADRQVTVVREF